MTAAVEIVVVREGQTWKLRYAAIELDYLTQAEAAADAVAFAHAFGKEGRFSTVRTGVMTSIYGPDGFIRAIPTLKRLELNSTSETKELLQGGTERATRDQESGSKVA